VHQAADIVPCAGFGHAATHGDAMAVNQRRGRHMPAQRHGSPQALLASGLRQDDHGFLAAPAAHQVDVAQHPCAAPGQRHQCVVADGVTVPVVDILEVIDVHQDDGERVAVAGRPAQLCLDGLDGLDHAPAIGQLGQFVRVGHARQLVEGKLRDLEAVLVAGEEIERGGQHGRHDMQLDGEHSRGRTGARPCRRRKGPPQTAGRKNPRRAAAAAVSGR